MIQTLRLAALAVLALAPAAIALPAGSENAVTRSVFAPLSAAQEGAQLPPPPPGFEWQLNPVETPAPQPGPQGAAGDVLTLPPAPEGYSWALLPTEQAPAAGRGVAPSGSQSPPGYPPASAAAQGYVTGPGQPAPGLGHYGSSSRASTSFHLLFGGRGLDERQWQPLDDQGLFGVEVHFAPQFGPLEYELGLAVSGDESNNVYLTLGEVYGGLRLSPVEPDPTGFTLRPYVGGGLTYIRADLEDQFDVGPDDGTGGWYARGGLEFLFEDTWSFTLDYRYVGGTDTDLTGFGLGSADGDLDGGQITLGFGFYF